MTAHEQCPPEAAKHFIMLARRIAESLELWSRRVARSELVAAVTEAGGFRFLGMVRAPVALIRAKVRFTGPFSG
jgi:hypothetical protein